MKRVAELTPADLERAAVWRYDGASDDVATVAATPLRELSGRDPSTFIARTQFALANGAQFTGFCSPAESADVESLQPVIATDDGLVYFSFSEPPTRESLTAQWKRLGAEQDDIFPIHFRCTVPVDGHFVIGTIDEDDLTGGAA